MDEHEGDGYYTDDFDADLAAEIARIDEVAALRKRGEAYVEIGRYDEGMRLFQWALARCPGDIYLSYRVMHACARAGRAQEMRRYAEAILRAHPDSALEHVCRAWALHALERPREALVAAEAALQEEPGSVLALTTLAGLRLEAGQIARAEETARHLREVEPEDEDAPLLLARCAYRRRAWREAEEKIREGLRLRPDSAALHLWMGRALYAQPRRRLEAISYFYEAARATPDDFEARTALEQAANRYVMPPPLFLTIWGIYTAYPFLTYAWLLSFGGGPWWPLGLTLVSFPFYGTVHIVPKDGQMPKLRREAYLRLPERVQQYLVASRQLGQINEVSLLNQAALTLIPVTLLILSLVCQFRGNPWNSDGNLLAAQVILFLAVVFGGLLIRAITGSLYATPPAPPVIVDPGSVRPDYFLLVLSAEERRRQEQQYRYASSSRVVRLKQSLLE